MTQSWKMKWKQERLSLSRFLHLLISDDVNFNLWLSGMPKWLIAVTVWHLGNTVFLGKCIVIEERKMAITESKFYQNCIQ